MTYWIRPLVSALQMGGKASNTNNPFPQNSHAALQWASGNAFNYGTPAQAFSALEASRKMRHDLADKQPGIDDLARLIELPTDKWPGNCATIAAAILPHLNIEQPHTLAYGFYSGPVKPGTMFAGRPVNRHGWIETLCGIVIDPTRWVFQGVDPYLFVGQTDDYDYGMLRYKASDEMPDYRSGTKVLLKLGPEALEMITELTGVEGQDGAVSLDRNIVAWIANLPIELLGLNFMEIICEVDSKSPGLVPFDTATWKNANLAA